MQQQATQLKVKEQQLAELEAICGQMHKEIDGQREELQAKNSLIEQYEDRFIKLREVMEEQELIEKSLKQTVKELETEVYEVRAKF